MDKKTGKRNAAKRKIGRVNIRIDGKSYQLRFTDPFGDRKSMAVCPVDTEGSLMKAELVAKQIDSDIAKHRLGILDTYDPTLSKYRPGYVPTEKRVTLLDYWEKYKNENSDRVSRSRQLCSWKMVDKVFQGISKNKRNDIEHFKFMACEMYSGESLKMIQTDLNASLSGQDKYPRIKFRARKRAVNSRSKEVWNQGEINQILKAFDENRYCKNQYCPHRYYYEYVAFLAWTGCRPEETIALTWDDVTDQGILINKVFVQGKLEHRTKTGKERSIPLNKQLKRMIEERCRRQGKLLFPAPNSSDTDYMHINNYLNHKNFSQRVFKSVVSALYEEELISKMLPPYSLRNSWITLMLKKGLDLATVAKLAGTSEKMILQHYWGADDSVIIPEI